VASQGSDPNKTDGSSRESEDRALSRSSHDGMAEEPDSRPAGGDPDVLLDVPVLNVEEIDLEVEDLRAHVSVRAELADLVKINVGVDAYLDKVKLGVKGVEAQVLLKVKLERILGTIERALEVIDDNPEILGGAIENAGRAAGEIGESAGQAVGEVEDRQSRGGEAGPRVDATEAAERRARELGVDLAGVEGTGSGGRVLVKDVEDAAGDNG
jgi:pyruvate/2-oxoglutarate dehydrogenase complex dihydrolipoamide acyltransferase (E2) component